LDSDLDLDSDLNLDLDLDLDSDSDLDLDSDLNLDLNLRMAETFYKRMNTCNIVDMRRPQTMMVMMIMMMMVGAILLAEVSGSCQAATTVVKVVVAPEKTIIDPESPLSVPAPEPEPEMDPAEGLDPDDPRLFLFGVCYSSDDCCPGSDCFFPRLSQGYMLCIAPTDQIYPNIYHVDPLLGRGCN